MQSSATKKFWRLHWVDLLGAAALLVATFFVHDVGYALKAPFWLDEDWVAISTRLPLGDLARDASSTPVGWELLLRLIFIGGDQRYRLLPLAFAAAAAVMAYVLARSLPWRSSTLAVLAGALAGLVALMAPASLLRNDLKQYTADVFMTLLLLWLLARLEAHWSRRRLLQLCIAIAAGFLFSVAAAFAGAAVLLSGGLVCLSGRRWRRLVEVTVAAAAVTVPLVAFYLLFYRPGNGRLGNYWQAYYLHIHLGWRVALHYLWRRSGELVPYLAVHNVWAVLALLAVGVLTLFRLQRPAVALAVPLMIAEMVLLGAAKLYPLLDERTSSFLLIAIAVVGAIGVGGVCSQLARVQISVPIVAALVAASLFVATAQPSVRAHSVPAEDFRTPTQTLARYLQPGDVVLMTPLTSWGFSYYWPQATPRRVSTEGNIPGFITVLPEVPNQVVASDRTYPAIAAALTAALAKRSANGGHGRVWIVREHIVPQEIAIWKRVFEQLHLTPQSVVSYRLMSL